MRCANSNTSTEHVDERSTTREVEDSHRVQLRVHSNLIGSRIPHQSRDQRCTRVFEQQDFGSKTQTHAILRFRRVRRTWPVFFAHSNQASTLFGGPSQPEPLDERGGIHRARMMAQEDDGVLNVNQYENDAVSYLLIFTQWSYG